MPAIMVGTATIATQAEILRMSAFCWTPISLWRTATWVRLAWRTLVSSSRPLTCCRPPAGVVLDVAEVLAHLAVQAGTRLWTRRSSGSARGAALVELDHLALEQVDALGRVAALVREDLGLDLLDVLVEPVDHRLVVVHDPVEDGVQHRPGPKRSRSGRLSICLRTSPRALAGLWRTATTNWGPMNSMISPNSTVSVSPT